MGTKANRPDDAAARPGRPGRRPGAGDLSPALVGFVVRSDLRRRGRSLAALALFVAVVVSAVMTSSAGARRTDSAFDRYLHRVRPADAILLEQGDPLDPRALEEVEGVQAAVGFRWFAVFPLGGPDGFYFIPMFLPEDRRVPADFIRAPIMDGRAPDPDEPLEIAVGERTARRLGVGVGDRVPTTSFAVGQQLTGGAEDGKGPKLDFEVVGILRNPGDIVGREADLDPTVLSPAFGSRYGDEVALFASGVFVVADPGVPIAKVSKAIRKLGPFELETSIGADSYRQQADPTLRAMATGLRVIALIVALAGAVLIVQYLQRGAAERMVDGEVMRALGASRALLFVFLSLPSALAVLTGILAGAALSVALSPIVLWGLARRADPGPALRIDLAVLSVGTVGAAVLGTAAVAVVASIVISRYRTGQSAAARPSRVAARVAGLGASVPVVTGFRMALDRGRGERSIPIVAAAVAAAIGGMGLMATTVFAGSLHHAVTTPAVYGWAWDGELVANAGDGDNLGADAPLTAAMARDPAFAAVAEVVTDLEVTIEGAPDRAEVLEDVSGHTPFAVVEGREPIGSAEVALGGATLDDLGKHVGDTVAMGAGGRERDLRIVGQVALPVGVDGGSSSHGAAMRREAADAIGFNGSCDGDVSCSFHAAFTTVAGTSTATAIGPYASKTVQLAGPAPPADIERLRAVDGLPQVLAGVLAIIAILAVTNAAAVTVRRRRADLAVLRVVGLSTRQLRRVVSVQVGVLALGGTVLGTVLGLAVGRLLWAAVADSVHLLEVIAFAPFTVVVVPAGIALLAQLGTSLSRRSAGRMRAAVALRAE